VCSHASNHRETGGTDDPGATQGRRGEGAPAGGATARSGGRPSVSSPATSSTRRLATRASSTRSPATGRRRPCSNGVRMRRPGPPGPSMRSSRLVRRSLAPPSRPSPPDAGRWLAP
jgi:hypothetical protein